MSKTRVIYNDTKQKGIDKRLAEKVKDLKFLTDYPFYRLNLGKDPKKNGN